MKNKLQFAQKAIIYNSDKVLVVKNKDNISYNPGMLHFPGGRMSFGEGVDEHIIREVMEETGIVIKPLDPITISSWVVKAGVENRKGFESVNHQIVCVYRYCKYISGEPTIKNKTDDEHLENVFWIDPMKLLHHPNFDKKQLEALEIFIDRYLF